MNFKKKLLISFGSLTAIVAPVAAVVSCGDDSWKKAYEDKEFQDALNEINHKPGQETQVRAPLTYDLTETHDQLIQHTWHAIFRDSKPLDGDIFHVTVNKKEYTYVWDSRLSIPSQLSQSFVEHLADKFIIDSRYTLTRSEVIRAFGFNSDPAPFHNIIVPLI